WLDVVQKSPDKWRAYSALGVHYNSLGDRKKAITMFEESKKKDPARPDPYINLCALYPSEGNLEDAGVNCRKGLKLKPGSFEANFNYGAYNFKMKRYEKSARFYGRAAKIRPYSIPSKLGQGAALAAMGNTAEAMRIFREILGQNPWNKQAHYNMAIIYKSLGNEAMANEHIQKARQGAPGK
ncbi:MAG: tetratricopeptide repeat protein, partial [Nitrospinota bacterium]|nr:tetratricopeptide repeat protein [Nitrospinota bacterium]